MTLQAAPLSSVKLILRHYQRIHDGNHKTTEMETSIYMKLSWSPVLGILYPENPGTCRLWNIILNEIYKLDTSAAGIFLEINGKFRIE